jgi:hypothetical protein
MQMARENALNVLPFMVPLIAEPASSVKIIL